MGALWHCFTHIHVDPNFFSGEDDLIGFSPWKRPAPWSAGIPEPAREAVKKRLLNVGICRNSSHSCCQYYSWIPNYNILELYTDSWIASNLK